MPDQTGSSSPIVIFGASSFARLVREQAIEAGRDVMAFVIDDAFVKSNRFEQLPLLGWSEYLRSAELYTSELFAAVGYRSMRFRREVAERARAAGRKMATIVSPAATLSPSSSIGAGTIVFPGCIVEPFASIGTNNVLWSGSLVCHDSLIGDDNYLAPGVVISGNCRIGGRCFLGTRCSLIDHVQVGDECHIAPGSQLWSNAEPSGFYSGIPARREREIDPATGVCVKGRS